MPEIIEIEGDVVRHIRREIVSTTTLAAAAPHLEVHAPAISPVLPRGTVLFSFDPDEKRGAFLVEHAPMRVNITVHFDRGLTGATPPVDYERATAGNNGRTAQFNIQLPYLYFLYGFRTGTRPADLGYTMADFTIDRSNLYMLREPFTHADQKLYMATLLNVKNARICWGYTQHDNDSLAVRINHMINEFAVTIFNNHYGVPLPRGVTSLTDWETRSEGNPLFYREWDHWNQAPDSKSAADLLRAAMVADGTTLGYTALPIQEDRGHIIIPEPPRQFTIARLREWMREIPAPLRTRFLAEAAAEATTDDALAPEEAYEAFLEDMRAAAAAGDAEDDDDLGDDDFDEDDDIEGANQ